MANGLADAVEKEVALEMKRGKPRRKLTMKWTPAVSRAAKAALALHGGMAIAQALADRMVVKTKSRRLRDPLYDTDPATSGQIKAIEEKLLAIDTQLGILVKMLTLDPKAKMPVGFKLTWAGGRKPKRITPAGMFLRAVLAGVPFTVNGVAYRPVRKRSR